MRLTNEDLINIAKLIDDGVTRAIIAGKYNYDIAAMGRIIARYKKHGLEGILHGVSKSYSTDKKIEIINRYYAGESQRSLAIELNVNIGVIHSWIKKYEQLGYNGLKDNRGRPGKTKMGRPKKTENNSTPMAPLTDNERQELNELRKKTYYQQMEIDCLKKIQALVQKRQSRQTKKKQ